VASSAEIAELAAELTEVTPDPVLVVKPLPLNVELLSAVDLFFDVEPVPFPDA
jgi:hypothetical protein